MKAIEWLKGKKTYIIISIAMVLALLQGFGICEIPKEVWELLLLAGGATASAKVNRIIEALKERN